jgi:mono/diheme cytochrome c family protein
VRGLALIGLVLLAACEGPMNDQARVGPFEPSAALPSGGAAEPPHPGAVARGALAREQALLTRPAMDDTLLQRGRERYAIFCTPCHGAVPDGTGGMVAGRYVPNPPSLLCEKLRAAPDEHLVDVITNGYGRMYPYASRIPPEDRWAIVAYVRALQLSQQVPVEVLPEEVRTRLEAEAP